MLEQNYQFDLLSPQKLLEKYVGRTVNVYRTNPQTGVDEAVEAEILSSTHPFEQTDAWTFTLTPEVEANGETRVEYRVRVRWC